MIRHGTTQRAGMALLEMLAALLLVSIAMNVGVRLLGMIARTYREAPAASRELRLQSQWLAALRRDAWQAQSVQIPSGPQLSVVIQGRSVTWRQEAGRLTREAPDGTQQWPLAQTLAWQFEREVLMLTEGTSRVPLATPSREAVQR